MKVRNKKLVFSCLSSIVGFIFLAYLLAWLFGPGSYPRAETYNFNLSEDSLIAIIKEVKNEHPQISINEAIRNQEITNGFYVDGKSKNEYWYHIYFHYKSTNEIVYTWTRSKDSNETTFAFHLLTNLDTDNSKVINENFWWWKNKADVEKFEREILSKINEKIKTNNEISQ